MAKRRNKRMGKGARTEQSHNFPLFQFQGLSQNCDVPAQPLGCSQSTNVRLRKRRREEETFQMELIPSFLSPFGKDAHLYSRRGYFNSQPSSLHSLLWARVTEQEGKSLLEDERGNNAEIACFYVHLAQTGK